MRITRHFVLLVTFLSLFAGTIAACASQKTMPPTALPKPTVPERPLSAEEIFTMAADRMDLLKSYTYSVLIRYDLPEIASRRTQTSTGVVDVAKGKYERFNILHSSGGVTETEKIELLFVETTHNVYERSVSGATWQLSERPFGFVGNNIRDMKEQAHNLALVGEEKLNGAISCYHLLFDIPIEYIEWDDFTVTSATIRTDMWVSKDELLVRAIQHRFSGQDGIFDAPEVIFDITIFSINLPVSIPSPYR
ncbi:MAG: hypothetical protein ACOYYS_07825 [Chloroflexota bacterium]